jgi:hypothetical protein
MSDPAAGSARTSARGCAGGIFEMTSSESGQATFQYGDEIVEGEPRVIWRHTAQRGVAPFSRGASQAGSQQDERPVDRWRQGRIANRRPQRDKAGDSPLADQNLELTPGLFKVVQ